MYVKSKSAKSVEAPVQQISGRDFAIIGLCCLCVSFSFYFYDVEFALNEGLTYKYENTQSYYDNGHFPNKEDKL